MIEISKIEAFLTAPEGIDLVIVKVQTSDPEIVGYGCATFTQRASAVSEVVNRYLNPLLAGRDVSRIEDNWRLMMANGYWRGGPVLNNAVGGVDMALWDIAGKRADMPVYKLLGGACRDRVDVYRHADGSTVSEVIDHARALVAEGHRFVRCQIGGYGAAGAMVRSADAESSTDSAPPAPADDRVPVDPYRYMELTVEMLRAAREELGPSVQILHDVHERVPTGEIARFARRLEPARLFFLEDPVAPDQADWLHAIRRSTDTPIALGELFTGPEQWLPLIRERLIDFIRVHVSHVGGITPARKLAALCDAFGIRTAWHGPGDCSPFGHAANVHLDFASPNFGVQEMYIPKPVMHEVFPGTIEVVDGAVAPPDLPGLGIEFVEEEASRYPSALVPPRWTRTRSPDGTLIYP